MCNLVICALCFLAGTVVGVMLMCLLQAGRTGTGEREGLYLDQTAVEALKNHIKEVLPLE